MNNRKRVTLTFEIDDHDGYNDEAFMRRDFLQELVCCVNDPYEDTFVMKVEDADVPHEMTAREFVRALFGLTSEFNDERWDVFCRYQQATTPEEAVTIVEAWAKEHPEERSEEA